MCCVDDSVGPVGGASTGEIVRAHRPSQVCSSTSTPRDPQQREWHTSTELRAHSLLLMSAVSPAAVNESDRRETSSGIAPAAASIPPTSLPPSPSSTTTLEVDDEAKPAGPYAAGERDAGPGAPATAAANVKGGTRDLYFLPIPKRLQWDPEHPPEFTLLLNAIFGFSATFSSSRWPSDNRARLNPPLSVAVANLYYPQSILIELADSFQVPYERVTNIPTLRGSPPQLVPFASAHPHYSTGFLCHRQFRWRTWPLSIELTASL